MANFIQRLGAAVDAATKAYRSPSVLSSEKFYGTPFASSYLELSGNRDMRRDEWGVAAAYSVNSAVMAAIQVWEAWLDGLVWQIKDGKTDKVLVSSDMRYVNPYVAGAKFYQAVKYHDKLLHHGYFKSLAYSDNLYSETFIRYIRNDRFSVSGLQWLNPLYTEPQILRGKIDRYYYTGRDESFILAPNEVAFRIGLRDPNDDLRGQSRVLTAIDAANLEQNTKKALRGLFSNGMILGGLISPKGDISYSPNQIAKLEDDLRRSNKGVNNAYTWAIAPSDIQFTQFTPPDVDKSYSIIQPLRNEILMAMGVPPQLANDPSQVNYDNADDMKRQWWEAWAIPYAKDIIEFHNAEILPALEPDTDIYFDFDFSPYETEKPEVVSQDLSTGIIDIYDAMRLRGVEPDEDFKHIRIINGVPMSKEIILKLANTIPAQYAADYAQADKLDAEAQAVVSEPSITPVTSDTGGGTPSQTSGNLDDSVLSVVSEHKAHGKSLDESAYAYIPLPNNSDVLAVQRELKKVFTDERIEWQVAPTYHVTMCYADSVSDEAISKIVSLVHPEEMEMQPVQGEPLGKFETPDGIALHIRLFNNSIVDAIQANVYSAFMTEAYDVSEYSKPENWIPHITLAYIPKELFPSASEFSEILESVSWLDGVIIKADEIIIGRGDYEPVVVLTAPSYKAHDHSHDDLPSLEDELERWRKVAFKHFKAGKAHKALGFQSAIIPSLLHEAISGVIESAKDTEELYRVFADAKHYEDIHNHA